MDRNKSIAILAQQQLWDVVIIGGGATGLGIAVDSASRGYKTLLLEAQDFAKGTSSRSTKLVHGGVRYLAQGDIALVREALRERGRLANNAPHLFENRAFIIPGETFFNGMYYYFGLWLYDRLSGKLSIGKTKKLTRQEALQQLPGVKKSRLLAGVSYFDGQFDDARLAVTLARTATENGATLLNYCPVTDLSKDEQNYVSGVTCQDTINNKTYQLQAKCVINATGVFSNEIEFMDDPKAKPSIVPSQGVHIVIDRKFMPSDNALMVPKTSDGRVLFAVPWHGNLVVGTTDTLVSKAEYEPKALPEEVDFILNTLGDYLDNSPAKSDIKSVFVGLRPLAAPKDENAKTKEVSRSHKVKISPSHLVHIYGGKWTTYRQMAEDTLNAAIDKQLLENKPCITSALKLQGYQKNAIDFDEDVLGVYGSDADLIREKIKSNPELSKKIHPDYPYLLAQVEWAIEYEMAQTLEDILARRIRLLFIDAQAAAEAANSIIDYVSKKLNWDDMYKQQQLNNIIHLSDHYKFG